MFKATVHDLFSKCLFGTFVMFIHVLTYTQLETANFFGFVGKQSNNVLFFELLSEFQIQTIIPPIELHSKAIEIVSVFSSILPHYCLWLKVAS